MENEYISERDAIIEEIGNIPYEELIELGISTDEYANPTAQTIEKLLEYANKFKQISIYNENE